MNRPYAQRYLTYLLFQNRILSSKPHFFAPMDYAQTPIPNLWSERALRQSCLTSEPCQILIFDELLWTISYYSDVYPNTPFEIRFAKVPREC